MPALAAPALFDSAFLARLERLSLRARRRFSGQQRAERRSRRRGASLEFADYRDYTPGDDLRALDWNLFARLDRLYVRLYEEEEELAVHLLVDDSASMRWLPEESPVPEENAQPQRRPRPSKADLARRLAATLAYVGLAHGDRVHVHWLAADGTSLDLGRGKAGFSHALNFLSTGSRGRAGTAGPPDLARSLQRHAGAASRRRGLVIVLSDLFGADQGAPWTTGAQRLLHHGLELQVVQVLDPAEIEPDLLGDLRLADVESDAHIDLTSDEGVLRDYTAAVRRFVGEAETWCRRARVPYVRAMTDASFEDLALRALAAAGMVE